MVRGQYILYFILSIWFLASPLYVKQATAKEFVVVIDPGHGGNDPGAVGKISKEKDINLKVALKLGNLIKNNCQDVKVVYTRSRDVFISLDRRSKIANDAKADLFISIHTNALAKNHTVKGASTWTLGLARSEANLDVAKRENAVILYEDNYEARYAGFDPNSSESYIIFEFMQDKYMSQSVHFASLVQKQFKNSCRRVDRGVHQAGFLVLKANAMPSVLVELGFISTPEEERYLNSTEGIDNLARGIYRAFLDYKNEFQERLVASDQVEQPQQPTTPPKQESRPVTTNENKTPTKPETGEIIFKVQILASSRPLDANNKQFKGLKGVDYYKEGGMYKYTYGASANYNEIARMRRELANKFQGPFVIAFKNGKKMDVNAAIAEFKKKK